MDDQNKNLILATVLSFLVILVWFVFFPPEEPVVDPNAPAVSATETAQPTAPAPPAIAGANGEPTPPERPAADVPRIDIDTPALSGSISLQGGRIDRLALKRYRETLDPASPIVELLSPVGGDDAYYALFGWAPGAGLNYEDVPGANTPWTQTGGTSLSPGAPIMLEWTSPAGLTFERQISIDEDYLFTIDQSVTNTGSAAQRLAPYGTVARHGEPQDLSNFFILHEGVVRMSDGELQELDYDDLPDLDLVQREAARADVIDVAQDGWIGFTDKYWMTTLIPEAGTPFTSVAKYVDGADIYQTEARLPTLEVAPGETVQTRMQLFAGAKEWETIRAYEEDGIDGFIDSIDWGWFFFLTKPIFAVLHWLNALIGNMGWAIIGLTLLIKAVLFPLAYKSYVSMAKMKELQPEMEKLKEKAGDDRQKLQQGMMELYKKNKVNPASGCLPILLQIPIFFSLYKVIFVTLELRHAPWLGWIRDLSAPDPSSILNLFGLLPWGTPEVGSIFFIFSLGVLPILLGISMWLQQKLNPAPADPTQAMIFAWMPWVFMFMLGSFASGLVLYWIANNTITFTQQYLIMRSQGYKPDVFGNIRKSFARKTGDEKS
ncbi:membrane protein insertase YidC [Maribius pontilimi]|uniref:Membrane protein insertase YidC n=1 Tax=Palleronia pontilimi TaxID=1964209 RepID=A0A934IK55_9RHOB|nr:membrane protein insertase YidC [Palleronia pontilimi]MBJ3764457.1 membrane protein insertase YidC [Palleronia pontilimi]